MCGTITPDASPEPESQPSSPFERLPAELRSKIYEWVAIQQSEDSRQPALTKNRRPDGTEIPYSEQCEAWQTKWPRSSHPWHSPRIELRNLRIPNLAATSQGILREVLPDFCSAGRFAITIGPPPDLSRYDYQRDSRKILTMDLYRAQLGAAVPTGPTDPIYLTQDAKRLLGRCRGENVFRNVQFCLHGRFDEWRYRCRQSWEVASLTLVWQNRRLDVDVSDRPMFRAQELRAVEPAIRLARGIALRDGFEGFTIADLRSIAITLL